MTEIYEEEQEQNEVGASDETIDVELDQEVQDSAWTLDLKEEHGSDARRRLEDLLEERRLREELDDYF